MNKTIRILGFLVLIFTGQISYGQTNKEIAVEKCREGIRLEDKEGKYDEAIKLFEEAQKLDPENIDYPYEMAYAYGGKKEYKKASGILENLLSHKDVHSRVYQALGNAYDHQGMADKAIDTYEKGLKQFPNSGELYLELGNMQLLKKDYDKALAYYEKGIENDPKFPSNYYWAAKLFCNSDEEVWGMIYGEIFMNLERTTNRSLEISQLLFDTYKSQITFTSDTSFGVSFSKSASINIGDLEDPKKLKLPFGTGCYEMVLSMSVFPEKKIDINSLNRIRTRFVERYFTGDNPTKYPNILFDYQRQVKAARHFEAYNRFILFKGDEEGSKKWIEANPTKWSNFLKWYGGNKMQLDLLHRFYRAQY